MSALKANAKSAELVKSLTAAGGPYELSVRNDRDIPFFKNTPRTIREVVEKASRYGARPFIFNTASNSWKTYSQLFASVNSLRVSAKLFRYANQRVAVSISSAEATIILMLALIMDGAVPVLLPAGSTVVSRQLLRHLKCQTAFVDTAVPVSAGHEFLAPTRFSWDDVLPELSTSCASLSPPSSSSSHEDDEALITFTSGSTGAAKAIVCTNQNLLTGLMNMLLGGAILSIQRVHCNGGGRIHKRYSPCSLMASPISHVSGYMQVFLQLYLAGRIIPVDTNDVEVISTLVESQRVTSIIGSDPATQLRLLTNTSADLSSLTALFIAGYATRTSFRQILRDRAPNITIGTGYGLTETCGSVAVIDGDDLEANPLCSGRILPSVAVEICQNASQEASIGEIRIRGAMIAKGFYNDAGYFPFRDHWLPTGDIGHITATGELYILDRAKRLVQQGEDQVSCSEIERFVSAMPGVVEVAVFTLENSECPPLCITFRGDAAISPTLLSEVIKKFGLAPSKIIVRSVPNIPYCTSGKIDYQTLLKGFPLS